MSLFANLRSDRLITQIKSSNEPLGAETLKSVAKLKDLGPGAIDPTIEALADADKNATVALVGESGSGKSVTSLAILGLLPPENSIIHQGSEIRFGGRGCLRRARKRRPTRCRSRQATLSPDGVRAGRVAATH